ALLGLVEAASPVQAVEVVASELARVTGAHEVSFLIADFSGDTLIRLPVAGDGIVAAGDEELERLPLAGSVQAQALRSQQLRIVEEDGTMRLHAPVTDRGEAIGILELSLPSPPGDDLVRFVTAAAHALSYVVIANRRHTDLFERGQRNLPFSLAAEIQRRLLPEAFTCEAAEFTVAGWLEPASEVGGDTFDYCVERDLLHLSISDAKGHTVHAAQLATLAVSSLRNSRRSQASVAEQAVAASEAIQEHAGEEDFVSALLLRVMLSSGEVTAVNAGHPTPHLVRDGVVSVVDLSADLPFGMMPGSGYTEQAVTLHPGDRLILLTDGILERNATTLDVAEALQEMTDLHPREVVHAFARAVLEETGGNLQDDATLLCLDWYGPQAGDGGRRARAGASQRRASDADAPTTA
ncbi:MAG: PP2C family protein-serine/threonine phosphatase, partial [Acidimicrobiales bacterium]